MVDCDIIKGAFCHGVVSKGNIQLEAVVALAGQLPVQPLDQLFGLFCREVVAGNEEFIAAIRRATLPAAGFPGSPGPPA